MATFTDRILVLPSTGVPTRIASDDTLELSSGNLTVGGNLKTDGSKVINNATRNLVADNHTLINAGYTTTSAQTGGLVVNYLPTATATNTVGSGVFTAGSDGVSDPTVTVADATGFSAGDLIQISGSAGGENDGIYEVVSHAANTITIRSTDNGVTDQVEDFTHDQFVANSGDVGASIRGVTLSILRAGVDGAWETGSGSSTPISFSDLGVGGGGSSLQAAYESGSTITLTDTDGDLVFTLDDAGTAADFQITDSGGNYLLTDVNNNNLILGSAANDVLVANNTLLKIGDGGLDASHDGSNTVINSATGNLTIDNQAATGQTIMVLGTDNANTAFQIQNDSASTLFSVDGSGEITADTGILMNERATPAAAATDSGYLYVKADGTDTELFFFSDLNGTDVEVQLTNNGFLNSAAQASTDFVAETGGVSAGDALYLASATEVGLADATISTGANFVIGIALNTAAATEVVQLAATPGSTLTVGTITDFSAAGDVVYLSETAGSLTTTPPTASGSSVFMVGYAVTATTLLFQPQLIGDNP